MYKKQFSNRLKRIEGQVRGVLKMMDEDKNCKEVITQLSSIRSSVDKTIAIIVAENLHDCILNSKREGEDTSKEVEEAIRLLTKSK